MVATAPGPPASGPSDPVALSTTAPTARPLPTSTLPGPRAALQGDQLKTYEALLAHVSADDYVLPSTSKAYKAYAKQRSKHSRQSTSASSSGTSTPVANPATPAKLGDADDGLSPLSDRERCFLSREQLQRFLRAVKWDLNAAITRTEVTVVWRREYGTDDLSYEDIKEESMTGKELVLGYDLQGRPLMHMYPYRQNTKTSPRQIQFVVWILERTIDLMPPGVETLCLCIDFGVDGPGQPTPLGQAKATLEILQVFYGERLGRAICVNVPTLPFIDPATKEKICFTRSPTDTRDFVDPATLTAEFGGDLAFAFEPSFFPQLDKICEERRLTRLQRWREIGNGRPGASEFELRGGESEAAIFAESTSAPANGHAQSAQTLDSQLEAVKLDDSSAPAA